MSIWDEIEYKLNLAGSIPADIVDRVLLHGRELESEKEKFREYKVYYDRIFSKSVVIPTDEYSDSVSKLRELEAEAAGYRNVIDKAAKSLDSIKFELNASMYTLEDDEFETTFYVRDCLQEALSSSAGQSLLDKLKMLEEENVVMESALQGFHKHCIKPECKCWACEALSKVQELRNEGK